MTHPRQPKITVPMRAKSRMKRRGDSIPIAWCTVLANLIIHALMLPPRLCRMEGSGLADERRCLRLGARTGPRATPAKADSSGLKPPRNDKREAVWHSSAPLRVGSEVVPFPKRTSGDARAYIDRSEEHTSELQSPCNLVCRLLLEKKKKYHSESAELVRD